MRHITRIFPGTWWICLSAWVICVAGCGEPAPIIGLKFPEPPPTRLVEGPGFTVQITENWTARTEGTKLIVTTPDENGVTTATIELQPYANGEDSETILDLLETNRIAMKLRHATHRRLQIAGHKSYVSRYTRLKHHQALDSSYYVLAAPSHKVVALIESSNAEAYLRDVIMCDRMMISVKLK